MVEPASLSVRPMHRTGRPMGTETLSAMLDIVEDAMLGNCSRTKRKSGSVVADRRS